MDKYIAGALLCSSAALLQGMKYIAAAIYMAGNASQSRELFQNALRYVGSGPDIMAVLSLLCGALFLIWGITESVKKDQKKQEKKGRKK